MSGLIMPVVRAGMTEYYMFEPWDVEPRDEFTREMMRKDKITGKVMDYGEDPHMFQSGIIYEYPDIGAIFAGTQVGKSYPVMIDVIAQCTRELPHALRYDKGEDTGVKRSIDRRNIIRWGRRDIETGEVIDHDPDAEKDDTWDCGTIIGAGKYPEKKFLERDEVIWIGTFKQAKNENWWPSMKKIVPDHLLDKDRGSDGFGQKDGNYLF